MFRLAEHGQDVDGAYGQAETEIAAAIAAGTLDPDDPAALAVVVATIEAQETRWQAAAAARRRADGWRPLETLPPIRRQIPVGQGRDSEGRPAARPQDWDPDARVTGSLGGSPDDPRQWTGAAGSLAGRLAAAIRETRHRARIESQPRRPRAVVVAGFAGPSGTYHARPYRPRR